MERERWEREIERVTTEVQAWKVVHRKRKRRRGVKERIKMEEWEGHFKKVLGEVNWRIRRERDRKRGKETKRE